MRGKYVYAALIALLGIGALYFMLWQARLGDFAESPQRVVVKRDVNRLAGGGRAGVMMETEYRDDGARLLVRCKNTVEPVSLRPGEESDPICGIRIRLEEAGVVDAVIVVSWDE